MQGRQADKQTAMQRQFAKNAIQWKAEDAKKAGIHPIYAMGANTVSYQPQQVGDMGIAAAGQDIGRAIDTGLTSNERISSRLSSLQIQRAELENLKLASEIQLMKQPGHPPAPVTENPIIPGQGTAAPPVVKPQEVMGHGENRATGPLPKPETEWSTVPLPGGLYGYTPLPSKDTAEQMESSFAAPVEYWIRNSLAPRLGLNYGAKPPSSWLPKGYDYWSMNPATGVWTPMRTIIHRR
jgi:hypothetical protein